VAAVILHLQSNVGAPEHVEWINARVGAKFQRVTGVRIVDERPTGSRAEARSTRR
jgi:hypothetical protein